MFLLNAILLIARIAKSRKHIWELNCADTGFVQSTSGILIGLFTVSILAIKLLTQLRQHQ